MTMLRSSLQALQLSLALACSGALGCAGSFDPRPLNQVAFLERALTQERDGVRVSVAVPSARETKQLFDANLYKRKVQPVWIEIENPRDEGAMFLPVGLDPAYFSPVELANLDLEDAANGFDLERSRYFFDRSLDIWHGPDFWTGPHFCIGAHLGSQQLFCAAPKRRPNPDF